MKCPYCDKEMAEGYMIVGKTDFRWTPKGEIAFPIINCVFPYEVLLKKTNYVKNKKVKVFRCGDCKIEIINENDLEVGD